jgi:hypothetical protein
MATVNYGQASASGICQTRKDFQPALDWRCDQRFCMVPETASEKSEVWNFAPERKAVGRSNQSGSCAGRSLATCDDFPAYQAL